MKYKRKARGKEVLFMKAPGTDHFSFNKMLQKIYFPGKMDFD